ncbi:MAG: phage DNA encapsidation protein [Treponema sp.]|nr:phage DNA encapsidation protein [Treponema sp.]
MKYYRLDKIDKYNARYNIIVSGRSDGKTYAVQEKIIKRALETGNQEQGAIIRRWSEDFTGKRGQQMFSALVENGLVKKYSKGRWNNIKYYASKWYFCNYDYDEHKIIETDDDPFCYGFALTSYEHDKSTSYPRVKWILFDEFITNFTYLPDEFVMFCNVISTLCRSNDKCVIYMLGNTISKYCPYFENMGLKHISKMKKGTIDIYNYGDSGLKVAVEYPDVTQNGIFKKKSDVFFAFDSPKLKMITQGDWQLDIYPHCPRKYTPKEVRFTFFIEFDQMIFHCDIVCGKADCFVFIHPKTTDIKDRNKELIYTTRFADPRPNIRKCFMHPIDRADEKIRDLYMQGKFFYSDNSTGDAIKHFMELITK